MISIQEFDSWSFLEAHSFPSPYVTETVSHPEIACANVKYSHISELICSAISLMETQPFYVSMITF